MPDTIERIEQYEELSRLLSRWQELEPGRGKGPFVRNAHKYQDDTVAGKLDRQKIAMAVRVACEAKGWILRVQDWPGTEDNSGRRHTKATVQRYTGEKDFQGYPDTEMRHGGSRCRTVAILGAYVEMLSDYPEKADAED